MGTDGTNYDSQLNSNIPYRHGSACLLHQAEAPLLAEHRSKIDPKVGKNLPRVVSWRCSGRSGIDFVANYIPYDLFYDAHLA